MINIFIGNLGTAVHTQDLLEYIHDGLLCIGEPPKFNFDTYYSTGINIALEGFDQNRADYILWHQKQFPQSKLFIVATESLSGNTFNSANILQKANEPGINHYESSEIWDTRYSCFTQLLDVVSGIIAFSESLYEDYTKADFGVPVFYLPMAALPTYVPIRQNPDEKKDIDIFFSGTITEYRSKILDQFRGHGLFTFAASPLLPEYLRCHTLGRSKLAIGLKLSESTKILSKARSHFYLTRRCPHLIEGVSEKTDLDPYLSFFTSSDIVQESIDFLASEREFDNAKFEAFKAAIPYEEIFYSLRAFLHNCPVRR